MITEHHYAARRFVRCTDKKTYRKHMCGLCHALGDEYGLASRMLTTHDIILLNLLTSAQRLDDAKTIIRHCPLNPLQKVRTNQDNASAFAAAVSVQLAAISLDDDIQDSNGRNFIAHLGRHLLKNPAKNALKKLESLGFDPNILTQLPAQQTNAEINNLSNPAAPSAAIGAALFAMTARLAGNTTNETALASAGAGYGTYIYLNDAYTDLKKDIQHGDFNPLRPFSEIIDGAITLSVEGETWLNNQLEAALSLMHNGITNANFHRDTSTLKHLITSPLETLMGKVNHVCLTTCSTCSSSPHDLSNENILNGKIDLLQTRKGKTNDSNSCCHNVGDCCCWIDCCCDCSDGDCCDCGDCSCD